MSVFHVFQIVQMLPNRATHHKCADNFVSYRNVFAKSFKCSWNVILGSRLIARLLEPLGQYVLTEIIQRWEVFHFSAGKV